MRFPVLSREKKSVDLDHRDARVPIQANCGKIPMGGQVERDDEFVRRRGVGNELGRDRTGDRAVFAKTEERNERAAGGRG